MKKEFVSLKEFRKFNVTFFRIGRSLFQFLLKVRVIGSRLYIVSKLANLYSGVNSEGHVQTMSGCFVQSSMTFVY